MIGVLPPAQECDPICAGGKFEAKLTKLINLNQQLKFQEIKEKQQKTNS